MLMVSLIILEKVMKLVANLRAFLLKPKGSCKSFQQILYLHKKISMETFLFPIFCPIFNELCQFKHFCKILPYFYNNSFGFGWRLPLHSLRAPLLIIVLLFINNCLLFFPHSFFLKLFNVSKLGNL